ncbi:MAG: hypothetical protein GQE15_05015 [Archangiaceae bacterium]|nr:hypothetical protein [Archangiaceae bacterium]
MAGNDHQLAQDLSASAAAHLAKGERKKAHELFSKAADLEEKAFEAVPATRVRTRGILAVSAASLLYKARRLTDARRFLFKALASDEPLLPPQESQLRELLEVVWDELSLPQGSEYSPNQIDVALRGGDVGFGTAPLGLALAKADEIMKLVVRFGEFLDGKPLRTRGSASPEILDLVQARITQPVAGSYRFSVRLVEPAQEEMFDKGTIVQSIAPLFFNVLRAATASNPTEKEKLKKLIPDSGYRTTMVKLLRNMVPADRSLREIELSSVHQTDGEAPVRESVVLFREVKESLNLVLRAELPAPDESVAQGDDGELVVITGVLRAVHLDDHWLLIVDEDGRPHKCGTGRNALDDLVGPMVNRRVEVRVRRDPTTQAFEMLDIEPVE